MKKNKKGQGFSMASLLIGGGVMLVVAVLLLAFSADIVDDIDNDFTANSYAANISTDGQEGLGNIAAQAPNIGTLLAVTVILGLVIGVASIARFRQ